MIVAALDIRGARPTEGEAIRALTLAAYEQYAAVLGPLWPMYRANIVETLARVAPAEQIVADRGGVLVGAVLLYPAGAPMPGGDRRTSGPEVRLLAVPPAERGQGVAERLMRECVRRARAAGATALLLHTTDMMQTAMRLYERLGFTRDPALDFRPAPAVLVKGFRLELGAAA